MHKSSISIIGHSGSTSIAFYTKRVTQAGLSCTLPKCACAIKRVGASSTEMSVHCTIVSCSLHVAFCICFFTQLQYFSIFITCLHSIWMLLVLIDLIPGFFSPFWQAFCWKGEKVTSLRNEKAAIWLKVSIVISGRSNNPKGADIKKLNPMN